MNSQINKTTDKQIFNKILKKGFEPADGGLAENVAVEGAEGQADVRLGEAQLDPPLLKLLGERLEVI